MAKFRYEIIRKNLKSIQSYGSQIGSKLIQTRRRHLDLFEKSTSTLRIFNLQFLDASFEILETSNLLI